MGRALKRPSLLHLSLLSVGVVAFFLCCCSGSVSGVFVEEELERNSTTSLHENDLEGAPQLPGEGPLIQPWSPSWKLNQLIRTDDDVLIEPVCGSESSIGDFPDDLFTREQRKNGAIILHIFAAFYFFTLLAVVCNDYFLPTIECICEDLKITPDVAAATFMAVSGAIPEFFTNMISTFITESEMGLGAVIGTLFFNTLGVAACAGIATRKPVQLEWYPLARDCLIFAINVSMLTAMSWDGVIQWYEGMILSIGYVVYWLVLFQNERIKALVSRLKLDKMWCCRQYTYELDEEKKPQEQTKNGEWKVEPTFTSFAPVDAPTSANIRKMSIRLQFSAIRDEEEIVSDPEIASIASPKKLQKNLWTLPNKSIWAKIWWLYTWPIRVLTTCLIPNPKTIRRLYPLSFVMCIIFIGVNSYLIFWMIVVMGDTFGIPEVVMGLTILCWGSCLPEAIACIIIIRKGSGGVGVSNSLGSNSMAILFSLGLPWLLRTAVDGAWTNSNSGINIYSHGINFIIMSILFAILALFVILSGFRYRLKKTIGLVLLLAYGVFLTLSLLLELNYIFPSDEEC